MEDTGSADSLSLRVGGLSREELVGALDSGDVMRNAHADVLLKSAAFDYRMGQDVVIVERTVADLGLSGGAVLSEIFSAAQKQGLMLCPPDTGPYLRLALQAQAAAPDSHMSTGRAPRGAVTVASPSLSEDDEYPKGFYLRVVDGRLWLRGYRCDDLHVWSPDDTFAFQLPDSNGAGNGTHRGKTQRVETQRRQE